jgi:fructose-1,6-bisphosphatase/inositol monophosphatase family enzyme
MSQEYGNWAAFAIHTLAKVRGKFLSLAGSGREVVEKRAPGYRITDPEIMKVDRVAEALIIGEIEKAGIEAVVLSEEAGRVTIKPPKRADQFPEPVYIIVDPFDGSLLYRRLIPAFWFSSLSVYSLDGNPLCAAVVNLINGEMDFANEKGAFSGRLVGDEVKEITKAVPTFVPSLDEAYLESYLMKPHFLYPAVPRLEPLFGRCKFLVPNGGPAGWADVATGRVDAYIALDEAPTEVFTGLPIAERAGAVISTLRGEPVAFRDDLHATYSILCSNCPSLHEQILEVLSSIEDI